MDGEQIESLVLAEEGSRHAERLRLVDQRAYAPRERHLRERDREPAVGDVVAGSNQPRLDRLADIGAGAPLGHQVDRRRRAVLAAVDLAQPQRLAEVAAALAERDDDVAGALEADRAARRPVGEQPDAADRGVGRIAEPVPSSFLVSL